MDTGNAIYTPTPKTIKVCVYLDDDGALKADSYLVPGARTEEAKVVGRGNLRSNGRERWYQVELADGSRHMVIGEGS